MNRPLTFICLLVLGFKTGEVSSSTRRFNAEYDIVGGNATDIEKIPYMVSLLVNNKFFCGGTIIDKFHILTAAHCVKGLPAELLTIRVGSSYTDREGVVHLVDDIQVNRNFTRERMDYDSAVVILHKGIAFNSRAKPLNLPEKELPVGTSVRVSGWGLLQENGQFPRKVHTVIVKVTDRDECNGVYGLITRRMFCASSPGKDSCNGDSGGGVVFKGQVFGIVSFGKGCAEPGYPGVYTNVADPSILKFIRGVIGSTYKKLRGASDQLPEAY